MVTRLDPLLQTLPYLVARESASQYARQQAQRLPGWAAPGRGVFRFALDKALREEAVGESIPRPADSATSFLGAFSCRAARRHASNDAAKPRRFSSTPAFLHRHRT